MEHRWIGLTFFVISGMVMGGCGGARPRGDSPTPPPLSEPIARADVTPFRAPLEPYGEWIESPTYGTAWIPYATAAGWRPYTTGQWLSTNHGWMWLADEPWGWAAFHYGRWTLEERLGWVWIPGNSWAPAWVAWRHGQGYVGWAPLAPGADAMSRSPGDDPRDLGRGIDPFSWSFVRGRELSSKPVTSRIEPVGRNPTMLSQTQAAGQYVASGTRVAERGFSESGIVERPRQYRVVDAVAHRQNRAPVVTGSSVEIYRPEALKSDPPPGASSLSKRPPGSRAQDLLSRERREQERFDERMAKERERLRREQERERRLRPESLSEDRLRKRQRAETDAQESFERRERKIFENRRERLRALEGPGPAR
jgi:hypothetical protein